ncbi:Short chain dehydrogenase sirQ [Lachnellula suecica]|uniref:Short chain dehydrogenase sirQ n=1 Tax=Lachnellula suecica TaxID=602035 RepID=A0A8T9CDQ6_9HELO|nr:Short chain dehydrogenase sirQ [Lachnellula suecica]
MSTKQVKLPATGMQALIFGASGITGWAITNAAVTYPTPTTFNRIVGLTSRPLSLKDSGLPDDSRLQLYSGLDLSQSAQDISKYLKSIENIHQITHVYFAAYVHRGWGEQDSEKRIKENVDFIVNSVAAVEQVCPNLQFWTFPTGGKWYGFEYGNKVERVTPLKENAPRIPSPYGDNIFYYPQVDKLAELAKGKAWKFADVRPDAIVGFVPNHNPMNIAEPLALYLSLWKSLRPHDPVPFPGTAESYTHGQSNISSDQLGRFHIYVSLHPEKTAGEAFNIADEDGPVSWEMVWSDIAAFFGLNGVGPIEQTVGLSGEKWVMAQKEMWGKWTEDNGLRSKVLDNTCWDFMTIVAGEYSTFDRHFDISKARSIGYLDSVDHAEGYRVAFRRMRAANIIP